MNKLPSGDPKTYTYIQGINIDQAISQIIEDSIFHFKGNINEVCFHLKISRSTLYRIINVPEIRIKINDKLMGRVV